MVPAMAVGPANEDFRPHQRSSLVIRNVKVHGHRTSVRLEPQMWDSMTEICRREFCTPDDV
jgi:predicted DNA-binding ribbon-helix-helix protein